MVRRGLARSRSEARHLITQGRVRVDDAAPARPASLVAGDAAISVIGPRYAGRGGEKLAAALDRFGVKVAGRRALDLGAAAGGFTDCLLQRGASHVVAVDVGSGQLSPRLRARADVTALEQTDLRSFEGGPFPLVVADLSFVSVCAVAADLARLCREELVVLVKPQFEVGRESIGRGVVRRSELRERAVAQAKGCLQAAGFDTVDEMESPLPGEYGNREYFVMAKRQP
jgi:23S rRNA (cytidine1920-2'-O)/16S rRNA (cytidine1409-2'-O)-methyltransferase